MYVIYVMQGDFWRWAQLSLLRPSSDNLINIDQQNQSGPDCPKRRHALVALSKVQKQTVCQSWMFQKFSLSRGFEFWQTKSENSTHQS